MARMTSHGQPVEALAHAGETVLRTESVKSVDRRTETNCGSKTLSQRQQHIGAAAGEDSGHGETSLDQHLLETEVETAEAWATYLAECFDSYKLIQHAGAYSFAGDCSGADAPWQVIGQLQKALKKKGLQWTWTHAFSSEDPTHAGDTARIFLALNSAPPIISDDMTVRGGPCRYAKGLVRTPSWNLYVAGWVCQDVCSANTVAPKPLRAEVTDSRGKSAATPEGDCRSPRHEEPMSGEWDDECADMVAGEWDHNDAQSLKPKQDRKGCKQKPEGRKDTRNRKGRRQKRAGRKDTRDRKGRKQKREGRKDKRDRAGREQKREGRKQKCDRRQHLLRRTLNIQRTWTHRLLLGTKTVEVRKYPLDRRQGEEF